MSDPENISLSIVIPAWLEESNIVSTLDSLSAYFTTKPYRVEYLVVDDGSTDRTGELARQAGATVITLPENRGKGAAVRTGMLAANGEFILFTDADYPYDIEAIELCFDRFNLGADVVIGSRNVEGSDRGRERLKRRIISRIGNITTRLLILPGITDTQAGFKCFRRDAAHRVFSLAMIDGWGFDIEALYIARMLGLTVKEVPVRLIPRAIKPSRVTSPLRTAVNVLGSIFKVYMNRIAGKYRITR